MARLCKYGEIHDVGDVGKAVVLLMMTRMMVVVVVVAVVVVVVVVVFLLMMMMMMMMMMMLLVAVYSNLISTHSIEFSHPWSSPCCVANGN